MELRLRSQWRLALFGGAGDFDETLPAGPRPDVITRMRPWGTPIAVMLLLLLAGIIPLSFANWSELSTAPDEAAHYVTSLMIRTYATDALGSDPRSFAEQFYLAYPKVAFGIWPPLFHMLLAGWLMITGPSFTSALVFMVLTTVLVCVTIYLAGRDLLGIPLAVVAAVWFATFPAVQASASSVMMDMMCALFTLQAAYAFGRYLDAPRPLHAWHFALAAAAGLLTKYNAFALALVPPAALLISRQWFLLKRRDFWLMPIVVAVLIAPWYLTHLDMMRYASEPAPPPGSWAPASQQNFLTLLVQLGRFGWPLVLVGMAHALRPGAHRRGVWYAMLALLVSVWSFHSLLYPIVEPRYMLAPLAALALFGAAGVHALAVRIPLQGYMPSFGPVRIAAAVFLVVALFNWTPTQRAGRGFSEAAELVLNAGLPAKTTTLVSADPIGEGAYVAYLATHLPARRDVLVLRASKLLASGTWMGSNYAQRFTDAASTLATLDKARVQYVVLDDSSTEPHHVLLHEAVSGSRSWRAGPTVAAAKGRVVRIYIRTRTLPPGEPNFQLDTVYALGRPLSR